MYFYAASLPHLDLAETEHALNSISEEKFFTVCELCGSKSDVAIIRSAQLFPPSLLAVQELSASRAESSSAKEESEELSAVQLGKPLHRIIAAYWDFERALRNSLVRIRAERRGQAAEYVNEWGQYSSQDSGHGYTGLSESLRTILNNNNPLGAENEIDALRWQFLNELEAAYHFCIENMIVYYMKLQIIARKLHRSAELGKKNYRTAIQAIYNEDEAKKLFA